MMVPVKKMRVDDLCYFLTLGSIQKNKNKNENKKKIEKIKMDIQWNISLAANLERKNLVFKSLHISRKYIKMIFRNGKTYHQWEKNLICASSRTKNNKKHSSKNKTI